MAQKFKGIRSFTTDESSAIGAGLSNVLKLTTSGMSCTVFEFGDAVDAGDTDYKDVDYEQNDNTHLLVYRVRRLLVIVTLKNNIGRYKIRTINHLTSL